MAQTTEGTLVLIKPDGIQRGLMGAIISRLETRGLKLVAAKLIQMDQELAQSHYQVHAEKPFFARLITFTTSSPVLAMVWQGKDAVEAVRNTMGATDPAKAQPGTIRGDMAIDIGRNLVHSADSLETAHKEISLFFSEKEILDYPRAIEEWVKES